jgi:uncharacterized membrane protein YcgQ (UPF0703/DUF1980 family)
MAKEKTVRGVVFAGICCIGVFLFLGCSRSDRQLSQNGAIATAAAENSGGGTPESGVSGTKPAVTKNAAAPSSADKTSAIEIKEKMFIAQTNDIYLNIEDYIGKTIRLEGLFKTEQYREDADPYCFVIRYGPGCCGNDGNAGFEVAWAPPTGTPDNALTVLAPPYPNEDDWVEAVGTLSSYEEDGYPYPYIHLKSLIVKDTRGAEFVSQ